MADDDAAIDDLQARWAGRWIIWRGRRIGDLGEHRTGDFVASRIDSDAGIDPTVIRSTAHLLDKALRQQRAAVAQGKQPLDVGTELRPGQ